eukprot:scaffold203567_cov19-Tisochrysis_lutea.AAC.1
MHVSLPVLFFSYLLSSLGRLSRLVSSSRWIRRPRFLDDLTGGGAERAARARPGEPSQNVRTYSVVGSRQGGQTAVT